jgi:4-amino-4-deoxy-L-arabinose transferase-like glycosyltransferase
MSLLKNINIFINKKRLIAITSLIILLIVERVIMLHYDIFPFNSDEAIVGLMAKHILNGERPLFFYGQAYMGSLDAYLVAITYKIFGMQIWGIRLVQILLYSFTLIFFYMFVIIAFDDDHIAFYSTLLLVIAPINIVLYTTVSLGGYGEAFLLGISALLISIIKIKQFQNNKRVRKKDYIHIFILGLICGLGLWVNAISLIFSIPALIFIFVSLIQARVEQKILVRILIITGLGFIIGSYPWWYAYLSGMNDQVFSELAGNAVAVESGGFLNRSFTHFLSFILFAPTVTIGLRPPWSVQSINLWFSPFVLLFWIYSIYFNIKNINRSDSLSKNAIFLLLTIGCLLIGGFIFTSFGVDPSGRYFLPLTFLLSVFGGIAIAKNRKSKLIGFLAIIVLAYYVYGYFSLSMKQPKITTQFYAPAVINHEKIYELSDFLVKNGEYYGYTNYWVAYPLSFISDEIIISIPALPYHLDLRYTSRDDRYPPYRQKVIESDKVFYITTNNPPLDNLLIEKFGNNSIEYKFIEIGQYHVFYGLSEAITPERLGIYETNP